MVPPVLAVGEWARLELIPTEAKSVVFFAYFWSIGFTLARLLIITNTTVNKIGLFSLATIIYLFFFYDGNRLHRLNGVFALAAKWIDGRHEKVSCNGRARRMNDSKKESRWRKQHLTRTVARVGLFDLSILSRMTRRGLSFLFIRQFMIFVRSVYKSNASSTQQANIVGTV